MKSESILERRERERERALVIHELQRQRGRAGRYLDFWVLDFEKDKRGHLFFVFSFFRFFFSFFFFVFFSFSDIKMGEGVNHLMGFGVESGGR